MVFGFFLQITAEGGQASVGAAVGMDHQHDPFCSVQLHGDVELIDQEQAVALIFGRDQRLCATGNADRICLQNTNAFQQLAEARLKAGIKAPDNHSIADIEFTRRAEVEYFTHGHPSSWRSALLSHDLMNGM